MSEQQVKKLFEAPLNLKEKCVVGLLYVCGLRISEVCNLKITDIDSGNSRIKVHQGKGAKDRLTLLPPSLMENLRQYYLQSNRPETSLFNSLQTKMPLYVRSL